MGIQWIMAVQPEGLPIGVQFNDASTRGRPQYARFIDQQGMDVTTYDTVRIRWIMTPNMVS